MSALGEKHGWLLADKHYLMGLLTVRAWGYWTGYTAAQIELMAADTPLIVWPDGNGRGKGGKKPSRRQLTATRDEWSRLSQEEVRDVRLSDILG